MSINKVEIQDNNGNLYYPHTDADVVKFRDSTVGASLSDMVNKVNSQKITSGTDLNTIKTVDVKYYTNNNAYARAMTNIPYASVLSFSLEFLKTAADSTQYGIQILREFGGSTWTRGLNMGVWTSWVKIATVNDSNWINLTLNAGSSVSNYTAQYRKIGDRVILRGKVTGLSATGTIGVLPTGFIPNMEVTFLVAGGGNEIIRLYVSVTGALKLERMVQGTLSTSTIICLNDISFMVN